MFVVVCYQKTFAPAAATSLPSLFLELPNTTRTEAADAESQGRERSDEPSSAKLFTVEFVCTLSYLVLSLHVCLSVVCL